MASIKGIQLKNVEEVQGADEIIITANVYLNDKKVGRVFGEGFWAEFDSKEIEDTLFDLVSEYYKEHPRYFIMETTNYGKVVEFLQEELLLLHDLEKEYKDNIQEGYSKILLMRTHDREEDPFGEGMNYQSPRFLSVSQWNEDVEKEVRILYPDYKNITVFNDLSDFIIK